MPRLLGDSDKASDKKLIVSKNLKNETLAVKAIKRSFTLHAINQKGQHLLFFA